MIRPVVVYGTGGLGRETVEVLKSSLHHKQKILGYLDDNPEKHGTILNGYPVLGGIDWLKGQDVLVVCGIGNNYVRKRLMTRLEEQGQRFITPVHKSAVIGESVTLGKGTVVTSGCTLTCNIEIGNHVFINLHSTIGHDVIIEDFSNLCPGVHISGNVHLKEGSHIYTGAVIHPGVTVGRFAEIGAGAVVRTDIPDYGVAVGVPAKVIKFREPEV